MSALAMALLLATIAAGADLPRLAVEAQGALEPAVAAAIDHFNASEARLRENPKVESAGPAAEPTMLRATYRRAQGAHRVTGIESGTTPVVTVRVRAVELEKRATNLNGDVRKTFAGAPWRETPRGYVLDFRLRWTGTAWEEVGEPTSRPTLGVAGD